MLSEGPKGADTPGKCSRGSIAQTVFHIGNTVNHLVFNDYTLPGYVLEWRWKENKKLIRKRVSNDITPHGETYGDILGEVGLHDKLICIGGYIFCFIDPRKGLNICKPSMNGLREIKAFPRDYIFDESTTNSTDWIGEDNDGKLYLIFVVNQTISFQEFLNISSEDENYYRRISLDNTEYFVYGNRVKKLNGNNYMKEKEIK